MRKIAEPSSTMSRRVPRRSVRRPRGARGRRGSRSRRSRAARANRATGRRSRRPPRSRRAGCRATPRARARAERERRPGPLHRQRPTAVLAGGVVSAVEAERLAAPRAPNELDRLLQPRDAHAGFIEADSRLRIVAHVPARADAQLETPVGEEVDRRRVLREYEWMTKVVAGHEGADAERRRRRGSRCESWKRRELASKVIRDEKDVVPGCLRSRCGCMPLGSRAREAELDPETEWAARRTRHGAVWNTGQQISVRCSPSSDVSNAPTR